LRSPRAAIFSDAPWRNSDDFVFDTQLGRISGAGTWMHAQIPEWLQFRIAKAAKREVDYVKLKGDKGLASQLAMLSLAEHGSAGWICDYWGYYSDIPSEFVVELVSIAPAGVLAINKFCDDLDMVESEIQPGDSGRTLVTLKNAETTGWTDAQINKIARRLAN
jgi:hypothetical protein